jgi:glucose/arabinose dehydrogenase
MKRFLGGASVIAAVCLAACGGSGGGDSLGSGGDPGDDPGGGSSPPPGDTTPQIAVSDAFPSLSFSQPTALKQAPGDVSRWFVAEKSGVIRVFANNLGSSSSSVFLDISAVTASTGEGGLLGFAFHPDFPATPEVYVSYTRAGLVSYLSRFTTDLSGQALDPATEEVVLTVLQPASNHNGGDVHFGPDGLLYIGFGDGGGAGDPDGNGQDDTNLHGTIVRIDVDVAGDYDIPPSNPNAANPRCDSQGYGSAPCPEIFAWGLRNPWRFSFDAVTGKLWAGDVGQNNWEEIDVIELGDNYGWNVREGAHCYSPPSGCATTFRDPITEYDHSVGSSVTGGYVYRGTAIADLVGWYVFGDFGSGRIFAIPENSADGVVPDELLDTTHGIVTFATGEDGELYFADFFVGTIHRIEPAP